MTAHAKSNFFFLYAKYKFKIIINKIAPFEASFMYGAQTAYDFHVYDKNRH